MKQITEIAKPVSREIKVVQFGEGNFLRGFVDYMIHCANEKGIFNGNVAVVKPIPYGSLAEFHKQENLYTLLLRGKTDGQTIYESSVISSIEKAVDCYSEYEEFMKLAHLPSLQVIVSNTTEAGIVFDPQDSFEAEPPASYPGKLTKFLYERYEQFHGAKDKGVVLLPVELIEFNGTRLRDCVEKLIDLWNLPGAFLEWVRDCNLFCNTLVDRIITGQPKEELAEIWDKLGYRDCLLDVGEPFALWVIESSEPGRVAEIIPFDKAGMNVIFTRDLKPYRERKVKILNGAHTATALAAYLAGKEIVLECMEDTSIRAYIEKVIFEEIAPTVNLPHDQVTAFAQSVLERFENPFIKHSLLSISLNSVSKWKARILPTVKDYMEQKGAVPSCLAFSMAALIQFYSTSQLEGGMLIGHRNGQAYHIIDDRQVLEFFAEYSTALSTEALVKKVLEETALWGEDLTEINGFYSAVFENLRAIRETGMEKAMVRVLSC